MSATAIVHAAVATTPPHHIACLWQELAEHSSARGDDYLRNLTPELVERAVLNAQWEPYPGGEQFPFGRAFIARGILGVAGGRRGGRRTAHVTVLVMQGADGNDFVACLWPGDPAGDATRRAA